MNSTDKAKEVRAVKSRRASTVIAPAVAEKTTNLIAEIYEEKENIIVDDTPTTTNIDTESVEEIELELDTEEVDQVQDTAETVEEVQEPGGEDAPDDEEGEYEVEQEDDADTEQVDTRRRVAVKLGNNGERKSSKAFAAFKTSDNPKIISDDAAQNAVYEQYINKVTNEGSFVGPRGISRVVLPYSGIYIDISSYTNSDMLGIHRGGSGDIGFVEKLKMELYSAYTHTTNNSFKKKLEFPEWLKSISLLDLGCIYWGIFNINHPGINTYTATCDTANCGEMITEKRDNSEITFVSETSQEDIDLESIQQIRNGVDREFIKPYKVHSALIERKEYLTDSKFKIFHGVPNLQETLAFLDFLKSELNESDEVIQQVISPLSWTAFDPNMDKVQYAVILNYKLNLFTRKILAPIVDDTGKQTTADGKPKFRVLYVDVDSRLIHTMINNLSRIDFKEVYSGKEVQKLLIKEGIYFRVKDSVCPKCKKKQRDTSLDMRDILFSRADEAMDHLQNM